MKRFLDAGSRQRAFEFVKFGRGHGGGRLGGSATDSLTLQKKPSDRYRWASWLNLLLRVTAAIPGHAMMASLRRVQWAYPNEQFAYMAQRTVEQICVALAGDAVRMTGSRRIALAAQQAREVA